MLKTLFFIVLVGIVANAFGNTTESTGSSGSNDEVSALVKYEIVPDLIDVAPPNVATIIFKNDVSVNGGNVITPTQTKDIPTVTFEADEQKLYTLLMIDPDGSTKTDPKLRNGAWNHWLVGNIPGNKVSLGETITNYLGSGPTKGSGFHRYTFLIFEQPGKLDYLEEKLKTRSLEGRLVYVREFSKKYNLGDPVAGNLYRAEWDEYVPILHAELFKNNQ